MKTKALFLLTVLLSLFVLSGCVIEKVDENGNPITDTPNVSPIATDNVAIEELRSGTGPGAVAGDTVKVHYTGTLTDGTVFDSSRDSEPFQFTIGNGEVIAGWEQGIPGMQVGGVRKLTIPPALGYGDSPQGNIPANSTLIFEVELLEIQK